MSVNLLDAGGTAKKLKKLIDQHDEIFLAVAWGSNGPISKRILMNKHKFRSVTFGLAFCQTDPDLIDELVDTKNAYVADGGASTFHPKLYYFQSGDTAEAIIGSSNFTAGGLDRNWEANAHIKGPKSAGVFTQVRKCLEDYAELRKPITKQIAISYRLQYNASKPLRKPKNPILPGDGLSADQLNSPLVRMNWREYVKAVKSSPYHNYDARLSLLREFQTMFARVNSFGTLSSAEWKAIAGVIGSKQKREEGLDKHDWKWFGAMGGMGDFANRIAAKDTFLTQAVDSIPRYGDVTRNQYEDFCSKFIKAFEHSTRVGGVPTATRLLAMKRPDTFVCISNPNRDGLSDALAFPKSTLGLENYWDRVVEPLRTSVWYTSPRPTGTLAELWDCRAAMLDAIYYRP